MDFTQLVRKIHIRRITSLTISNLSLGCPAPDVDAEGDDPPTAATSSPAGMSIVTGPSKLVGMGSSGLKRLNMGKVNYVDYKWELIML